MRLKNALLVVIAACAPLTLRADDASKMAKVHEFFKVSKMETLTTVNMNLTLNRMNSQITRQMGATLTPAQQQRVTALTEKLKKLITDSMSWDKMEPQYAKLYADAYTEQQLDDLIAFYKSPTGQVVVEKTPILVQQANDLSQERLAALTPQIQQMVKDFLSTPTIITDNDDQ